MLSPPPQPASRTDRRTWRLSLAAIFILTFLTHARSIGYGFSDFDDPAFVTDPTGYRGLAPENILWDFTPNRSSHYQPLTNLSYGLDYALWGLDPRAFHTTNILLHALNAVLVAALTRRLLQTAKAPTDDAFTLIASAAAALAWGLHPLRVESVAWVTERRDVLSTAFLLSAALAYLRHARAGVPALRSRGYWLTLALLLLSLLAKAWGMTFFVVALILDVYPLRRLPALPWNWRRPHVHVLIEKAPLAAVGLAAAFMATRALSAAEGTVRSLSQWGIPERLAQASYGLVFYLWKSLVPTGLAALYELPTSLNPLEPRFLIAFAVLATIAITVIALARRAPALAAAMACYAILVSPVLGLFQSGIQLVADRYSYIALIPLSILAGWCVAALARGAATHASKPRPEVVGLCAVVLLALAAASWNQTGYWSSTERTFTRVLDAGYDGATTRLYLGRQLEKRGDRAAAIAHYRRAVEMGDPDGESAFALGNALRAAGDLPAAESAYLASLDKIRDRQPVYLGLGLIAINRDDYQRAVWAFRHAVEEFERPGRAPDPGLDGVAYLQLAAALDLSGNLPASREYFEKATHYPATSTEATRLLRITDEELKAQGSR